jgi:hypothetical protein
MTPMRRSAQPNWGEQPPDLTRSAAARAAFRTAGVTQAREQVILLGPRSVVVTADEAYRSLRTLRDRNGQGEGLADYEPVLAEYDRCLRALRDAVRRDLGVTGSNPQIPAVAVLGKKQQPAGSFCPSHRDRPLVPAHLDRPRSG